MVSSLARRGVAGAGAAAAAASASASVRAARRPASMIAAARRVRRLQNDDEATATLSQRRHLCKLLSHPTACCLPPSPGEIHLVFAEKERAGPLSVLRRSLPLSANQLERDEGSAAVTGRREPARDRGLAISSCTLHNHIVLAATSVRRTCLPLCRVFQWRRGGLWPWNRRSFALETRGVTVVSYGVYRVVCVHLRAPRVCHNANTAGGLECSVNTIAVGAPFRQREAFGKSPRFRAKRASCSSARSGETDAHTT